MFMQTHGGKQMIIKDWKKEILTIPNLLSFFRLILIPVYMVIYLNAEDTADYTCAGIILAASCITDMFDGKIARTKKDRTDDEKKFGIQISTRSQSHSAMAVL